MQPSAHARNRGLDGLRGLAVLWVIGYHFFGMRPFHPLVEALSPLRFLLSIGWLGVVVFFVLSGYLITAQLVAARGQPGYWRGFLVKRTARILPAYLLLLASLPVAAACWPADRAGAVFNDQIPFWSHWLLVQNGFMAASGYLGNEWLRPTWSLAVEVQYYGFIALFVALCPPRWLRAGLVLLVLLALATRYAMAAHLADPSAAMMVLTISRLDSFALGGLVALIPAASWSRRHAWAMALVALAGAGLFVAYFHGAFGRFTLLGRPAYYTLASIVPAAGVALLVHARPDIRWPGTAALAAIGQRSYFLYLFHMPVLWTAHEAFRHAAPASATGDHALVGFLALGGVLALAWLSWRVLEAPALATARRALGAGRGVA